MELPRWQAQLQSLQPARQRMLKRPESANLRSLVMLAFGIRVDKLRGMRFVFFLAAPLTSSPLRCQKIILSLPILPGNASAPLDAHVILSSTVWARCSDHHPIPMLTSAALMTSSSMLRYS